MEQLAKLLGGYDRVKLLRYFLHHENDVIDTSTLIAKVKGDSAQVRKELASLSAIGLLEKGKNRVAMTQKKGSKEVITWKLDQNFPHNAALKELLFDFERIDKKELAARFKHVGRVKLFILAGVFVGSVKSRTDVLIVGEGLKKPLADKVFDQLAAELGRTVSYSIMDCEEFDYRKKMYDKFIRDIYDLPHEVVVDKLKETA